MKTKKAIMANATPNKSILLLANRTTASNWTTIAEMNIINSVFLEILLRNVGW